MEDIVSLHEVVATELNFKFTYGGFILSKTCHVSLPVGPLNSENLDVQ
jgi:hypothetical protein